VLLFFVPDAANDTEALANTDTSRTAAISTILIFLFFFITDAPCPFLQF
jgi:hypothetical protein